MSTPNDTVNRYPVQRATAFYIGPAMRPARIILVERDDDNDEPYVTAYHCAGDNSWAWGHYFRERSDALADFRSRADKHRESMRLATDAEVEQSINEMREAARIRKAG